MTGENKERHVETWKQSGLSGREYCRKSNLNYWTFRGWVKKEKPTSSPERLVKVALRKDSWESAGTAGFDLVLQDMRIRVPSDFNEESLLRLVNALRKVL
jgi:hypothetical protein